MAPRTQRGLVTVFSSLLLLPACHSTETRKEPAAQRAHEPNFAGRWTRDTDGAVFAVSDDGKTIRGRLATDPAKNFDDYTFVLVRDGKFLVGKSYIRPRESVPFDTAWKVHEQKPGTLVGENEWVIAYPDTGKIQERGVEQQVFTLVPPSPEELA